MTHEAYRLLEAHMLSCGSLLREVTGLYAAGPALLEAQLGEAGGLIDSTDRKGERP